MSNTKITDNNCPKLPWMIDFYSKNDKILNGQWEAAFADNHLEYLCKLNIESDALKHRMTKIMCTIGPSTMDEKSIIEIMKTGANILRLKMTMMGLDEAETAVKKIRTARDKYSKELGYMYNIAVCFDLQGAGIYTGVLEDTLSNFLELHEGLHTTLTSNKMYKDFVNEEIIYVSHEEIQNVVKTGDKLYLEKGTIMLQVVAIEGSEVKCVVKQGGFLSSISNVDMPGIPIRKESLTEKDSSALSLAVKLNIDMITMSEVQSYENIIEARKYLASKPGGNGILLIPKIELAINLHEFEQILELADGIYLARERLRIEIPTEKLFIVQKQLIAKCNKAGKPILCASSLLESMITFSRPLKAELADIANAVLDGSDCLVLSRETSIGDHPGKAVKMLNDLCIEAESSIFTRDLYKNLTSDYKYPIDPERAVVYSIIDASLRCCAAAIIVCTVSGRSAKLISRYKPRCPIIAVTRYAHVAQKLNLWRGVLPFLYFKRPLCSWNKDVDKRIQVGMTFAKLNGIVRASDAVVIVRALRKGSGFTNTLQIVYASEFDALPPEKP